MGNIRHWVLAAMLAFSLVLAHNTMSFSAEAEYAEYVETLSLELIAEIDNLEEQVRSLVNMGLAEMPDDEWFLAKYAYYLALNIAWAHGDEDDYKYYGEAVLDLLMEIINEVGELQVPEPPIHKQEL